LWPWAVMGVAMRAEIERAISADQRTLDGEGGGNQEGNQEGNLCTLDGEGGARVASALESGVSSTSTPACEAIREAIRGAIREAIRLLGRPLEAQSGRPSGY
jgi:hypothetical protein